MKNSSQSFRIFAEGCAFSGTLSDVLQAVSKAQLFVNTSRFDEFPLIFAEVRKSSEGSLFSVPHNPAVFPKYHP